MTDWTDTAKRMAAHPRWKPDSRMAFYTTPDGEQFPDLTDWATTGIELGMVAEALPDIATIEIVMNSCGRGAYVKAPGRLGLQTDCMDFDYLGQALGELWLELVA